MNKKQKQRKFTKSRKGKDEVVDVVDEDEDRFKLLVRTYTHTQVEKHRAQRQKQEQHRCPLKSPSRNKRSFAYTV